MDNKLVRHLSEKVLPTPQKNPKIEDDIINIVRNESGVVAGRFSSSRRRAEERKPKKKSISKSEYFGKSFCADAAAACTASFFVALPVATIDRAVVMNVAGTKPLFQGVKEGIIQILQNPIKAVTRKSYLMVFGVYATTYITANTFDSISMSGFHTSKKHQELFDDDNNPFSEAEDDEVIEEVKASNAAQFSKFLGVTAANFIASVSKDRAFARMYGTIAPTKLPMASWGCWVARDLLTIGCAFNVPKPLEKKLLQEGFSEKTSRVASQLLPVMCVQVFSTPLHLMANDMYNFRKGAPRVVDEVTGRLKSGEKTMGERMQLLIKEGPKTFFLRQFRILPAFGFGGIANTSIRNNVREQFGIGN